MDTLLLDVSAWDLVLDVKGNVAMATNPYALAQNAASACRLFKGELWYDTAPGIPYWGDVLGKLPPIPLLQARLREAALRVPGVVEAAVFISAIEARTIRGQVQVTDEAGRLTTAEF